MPVCVALTMGLQPCLRGSSPMCPTAACQLHKKQPKNPMGAGTAQQWDTPSPLGGWMGSHSSLVPPQGEMRASLCWVWQELGADTSSPEGQAELPCSLMSFHHCDPKTPPAPTPHSPSMGRGGQAQHPSLALDTECKAALSASACSCPTFYP